MSKLNGADLGQANLAGALLHGADLSKAKLTGATLSGAIGANTVILVETILPGGRLHK